jgi:hypothetical protein
LKSWVSIPVSLTFMKKKLFLSLCAVLTLFMFTAVAQTTFTLNPLNTFGSRGDGSVQPGDSIGTSPQSGNEVQISAQTVNGVTYGNQPGDSTAAPNSTNGFNMRGLSYDPVSGNLVFVDTHTGSGGATFTPPNAAIYILDSSSGNIIGALNTNGITSGGAGQGTFVAAGVADDGVVYAAGQINSSTVSLLKIHRWPTADTNLANFNEAPAVAFSDNLPTTERVAQTLDVRGSGITTEIIIGTSKLGGTGTNVYLFTTADGTNFTAHLINFPGMNSKVFNDGIAFGPGNTFFAKQVGEPLLFLSYDPIDFTNNTIIASYTASSVNDPLLNLSAISYDGTNNLLAGLEQIGGTANGGRGRVWLFDFPDPTNRAPAILASRIYIPNFIKATAPMGYMDFGGGRLYANVVNNGLLASTVDSVPLAGPTFMQNLPSTNRIGIGQTAHFEVIAAAAITNYQWYSNNVAIPGANTYFIDVPNVQLSNSGTVYKVVVQNAAGANTSVESVLTVVNPGDLFHVELLWSFATGEGFMTTAGASGTPPERAIAYDPTTHRLLVVRGASGTTVRISVVDPDNGAVLYTLKTNGIFGGSALGLCGIGVADDGAVYAANASVNDSFRIYRWADTGSNTLPEIIFGTNSPAATANPIEDLVGSQFYRFGDNLAVRGSGTGTEIVLDNQNLTTKFAAILRPTDDTMTNWTSTGYLLQNIANSYGSEAYGTAIGRTLQFGPEKNTPFGSLPTFWQKRYNAVGAPLAGMGYTPGGGIAPLAVANTGLPLLTNGPVGINFSLGFAAAVSFNGAIASSGAVPDDLNFYDFIDPSQAVLLSTTPFKANHLANGNAIAQVVFGANPLTGSNYVFVINGNNGAMGLVLAGGVTPPPNILTHPKNLRVLEGNTASLTVALDQPATIRWFTNGFDSGITGSSFVITNAQADDAGSYFVIATNVNGSVTSQVAQVTIGLSNDVYTLSQAWAAPAGDGSFPYVTSNGGANTPNERSFAYNSLSNQLIVVRCPPASTAYTVYVVDGDTGTLQHTLDTSTIIHTSDSEVAGSNPIDLVAAGVADDGAVYICSETPNASGGQFGDTTKMLHIYRWANSASNTVPALIYQGDPSDQPAGINQRWGDVLAVRGSGTNTELILNSFDGAFDAVLKPTDSSMATFTNFWFAGSGGGGSIGRSLQFGTNDTVFEKRKGAPLFLSNYNLTNQTSAQVSSLVLPATLGGVFADTTRNFIAGVDYIGSTTAPLKPNAVTLYDIAEPSSPMLVAQYNFPTNRINNANFICQTIITDEKVYALDANNGIVAFNIVPPPSATLTLNYSVSGTDINFSWTDASAILQSTPSLTAPIVWTDLTTVGQTNSTQSSASGNKFFQLKK